MKAIAFSRDRSLQLDGMLRSLELHATEPVDVAVIVKATTERHAAAYREVERLHPRALFVPEANFEADVRHLLANAGEHVLFLVDDTIFVRGWSPADVARWLRNGHLGFSLRLGHNTTNCYPIGRTQALPLLYKGAEIVTWQWPGADGDFGYPLEVSSSVYATADILAALEGVRFRNPNELEHELSMRAPMFAKGTRPRMWLVGCDHLIAYERSVAFSNPCNRVQTTFANRAGDTAEATADSLLERWEAGYRMRVEAYADFEPDGAHCEAPIHLEARA